MKQIDSTLSASSSFSKPSAAQYAAEPREFVKHIAHSVDVELDEATVRKLTDRILAGESRDSIIRSIYNIRGVHYEADRESAALHFARMGYPGKALIVENILSFAAKDHRAFVLHAFSQVLLRHPSQTELALFVYQLESGKLTRPALLKAVNEKAVSEGHLIDWDSAELFADTTDARNGDEAGLLSVNAGFRTLSPTSADSLTLCRFNGSRWELAPSMISRVEEVRQESWLVSDGFILTGPKAHIAEGDWLLELELVQPAWARLCVDVVANAGMDRLMFMTVHGNLTGQFNFQKLRTHAFLEVRLRIEKAAPGQWISIQKVGLRKLS